MPNRNNADNGEKHIVNIFRTILGNSLLSNYKRYTKTDLELMHKLDDKEATELFFFIRNTDFANGEYR